MLLADLGAEVVKVEGPAGDDTRTWKPPVRDGVSTYYLGINRNKRSVALDLKDPEDAGRRPGAGPPGRRADGELPARRAGPVRARLRDRLRRPTRSSSTPRSAASAADPKGAALPGYDLIVQAISGLMSLTGDPDGEPYRAGISVFDVMAGLHATIGILAALNLRNETGRGQHVEVNLMSSALSGLVNQSSAYVAGGDRAVADGQQPPEPVPLRAAALLRRRPDHHRRQQRPVPQAGRGARRARARRRPAVRPQRGPHRQPRRSCGRCWWSGCATRTKDEWFRDDHRRRRAVRPDQHHRRRRRLRRARSASTRSWRSATTRCRRCATRSRSPRRRPTTCSHRPGSTSTATRSDGGCKEGTR